MKLRCLLLFSLVTVSVAFADTTNFCANVNIDRSDGAIVTQERCTTMFRISLDTNGTTFTLTEIDVPGLKLTNDIYRYYADSTNYISVVYDATSRIERCAVNGVIKTNAAYLQP